MATKPNQLYNEFLMEIFYISFFSLIQIKINHKKVTYRIPLLVSLHNIRGEILFFLWLIISSNSPLHTEYFRYWCPLCTSRHHILMYLLSNIKKIKIKSKTHWYFKQKNKHSCISLQSLNPENMLPICFET